MGSRSTSFSLKELVLVVLPGVVVASSSAAASRHENVFGESVKVT